MPGSRQVVGQRPGRGEDHVRVAAQCVDRALADRLDPWSLALWFTGDNSRLGGLRPVDAVSGDPDAVLAAARALADDLT